MRTIELSNSNPSLAEVLEMARRENLVIKAEGGREFLLTEVDDFEDEVQRTRQNQKLMTLLDESTNDPQRFTHEQIKKELNIQ